VPFLLKNSRITEVPQGDQKENHRETFLHVGKISTSNAWQAKASKKLSKKKQG
jgi:hypothetical protein